MISAVFDLGRVVHPGADGAALVGRGAGTLPGMRRLMVEVGERFWGRFWAPLYDFLGGNPVAAMPSLHFATSVMAAHVLSETGRSRDGWAGRTQALWVSPWSISASTTSLT